MSREFKFRAWHKGNNKMEYYNIQEFWKNGWRCHESIYPHNNIPMQSGSNKCFCTEKYLEESAKDCFVGQAEFMQYTGLLDKNGKEIYEGDIVKSTYNARHVNYNSAIEETLMIVEHDDCNPCFVLVGATNKDKREYDFIQCGLRSNEVIGNIFENPELINNQKGQS